MATIIFTALGTVFGGPLGGAIGALVGRQVDGAIFGSASREGPRLKELSVTTSTYGTPIGRHHGRMRVAGSIIWATDLVEHRESSGGGKGRPSVTTYSYSASFAVAIGSRPVPQIGRIWADGNLLRGASGDLKAAGQFRFYTGSGDQPADPLMAAAEGDGLCPAYRGLAYAVFQDLQLADFGNRIPALTFEVLADADELNIAHLLDGTITDASADVPLTGIAGLSCEGPLSETLGQIAPVIPLDCDVSGNVLTLGRTDDGASVLREPTVNVADDSFGAKDGFARKRLPPPESPPALIRYYDIGRDYQPGMQRVLGQPAPGQPASIELPVATQAPQARSMIESAARRANWARQILSWRTGEIDPAVRPGSLVRAPGQQGLWRVADWEWRASGVELTLWRSFPGETMAPVDASSDGGRPMVAADLPVGETSVVAFELPWDGTGSGDAPLIRVAMSSQSAGWAGAAIYLDEGDGQLQPLTSGTRTRSVMGEVLETIGSASPLLFDRGNQVAVRLLDPAFALQDATPRQMAAGANLALIGGELIQFARAQPLGGAQWLLSGLLRGRGGTESAIAGHGAGERFVLLDGREVVLDSAAVGSGEATLIAAIGVGDEAPATSIVHCRGLTRRPLFPVRPEVATTATGLRLVWTRRARGAWAWLDGVETPLREEAEAYDVIVGSPSAPIASWSASSASFEIPTSELAALAAAHPGAPISVRQRGSYAVSEALLLSHLP